MSREKRWVHWTRLRNTSLRETTEQVFGQLVCEGLLDHETNRATPYALSRGFARAAGDKDLWNTTRWRSHARSLRRAAPGRKPPETPSDGRSARTDPEPTRPPTGPARAV